MIGTLSISYLDFRVPNSTKSVISLPPHPNEKVTTNCGENTSLSPNLKTQSFRHFGLKPKNGRYKMNCAPY